MKINYLAYILTLWLLAVACAPSVKKTNNIYDITDYGAVGDGKTICTQAIQQAIDEASQTGGRVVVPQGKFMTGTIFMKSDVTLEVTAKGEIFGSPRSSDYTLVRKASRHQDIDVHHLIYAKGQRNFRICGLGTINGNCYAFWKPETKSPRWIKHAAPDKNRLYSNMVELVECQDFRIDDITLKDSPEWTLHLFDCDRVFVNGLKIDNNLFGPNADGLDLSGCQDVMISNCHIKTCDDAICIKTFENSRDSKNITVTNCVMQTLCVALKAEESYKRTSDVTFSNCVIYGSSRAIALYTFTGGIVENINISNIVANTNAPLVLNRPIHIGVWDRNNTGVKGIIRNVSIQNFTATTQGRILITAGENDIVENITLRDIHLIYPHIENPIPFAETIRSAQFKGVSLEAKKATAAVVLENLRNVVVDNLMTSWTSADTIPSEWKHPEKIENGSDTVHLMTYDKPKEAAFGAVWAKNVKGGYLYAPLATSSDGKTPKWNVEKSEWRIKE